MLMSCIHWYDAIEEHFLSVIFFPQIHNPNIMRKHQKKTSFGSTKFLTNTLQKCEGLKKKRKYVKPVTNLPGDLMTK